MIVFIYAYTFLAGFLASSANDFLLCSVPLCLLLIITTRARPVDVFVLSGDHYELAEKFIDVILEDDAYYESARIMLVNPQALQDELDQES